uniref:Uncharacterized protein n=1 Tax=Triticum urartu TaxID=4572 RepID=A0A8R7QZR7_TRIUA
MAHQLACGHALLCKNSLQSNYLYQVTITNYHLQYYFWASSGTPQ